MTPDRCIFHGCPALAPWGYGSVLRGTHRSACTEHRHAIWPDVLPPTVGQLEDRAVSPEPARSSLAQEQGSLFE